MSLDQAVPFRRPRGSAVVSPGPAEAEAISIGDVTLAAAAALTLLFSPQLGALGPVAITGVTGLMLVTHLRALPKIAAASWLIFLAPLLALGSAVWSVDRGATLYYGVQYLITILLGLSVGALLKRDSTLLGLFIGWGIFTCVSLLLGKTIGAGAHGQQAFSGLTGAKNFFGDTSTLGAITSIVTLVIALTRRWRLMALVAALILFLQLYSIRLAFSTGSILGVIEAATVVVLLLLAKKVSLKTRYFVVALLAFSILAIVGCWGMLSDFIAHFAQDVLHKDATLTGRTVIWDTGRALVRENPVFGSGFYAFWRQGNLDAEGIWRTNGITSRAGFNFHSTSLEILVELGYIGLIGFLALLAIYGVRLLLRSLAVLDAAAIYWCAILIYELGRMPYEAVGLATYGYATVLLAGALVAGAYRRDAAPAPSTARLARTERYWRLNRSVGRTPVRARGLDG